jgi:acetyl esterase/lipase
MRSFARPGAVTLIITLCLAGCGQDTGRAKPNTAPEPQKQPDPQPGEGRQTGKEPETGSASQKQPDSEPYLSRRASFKTALIKKGPSPDEWTDDPLPDGVTSVNYQSDGRTLKAWLFVPKSAEKGPCPALVYLHGGFAFAEEDFAECRPFTEAGYVVMCPTFRGENGNPGDFEMMLGEVDDAAAAIRWLATQKHVDPKKIFVFGHSSGGIISAILSLYEELPVVHTGSSGGLYGPVVFSLLSRVTPFDRKNPRERQMRILIGNIRWMKRPHYAFTGDVDALMKSDVAKQEAADAQVPLTVIEVPGDHDSSLGAAMRGYLDIVRGKK